MSICLLFNKYFEIPIFNLEISQEENCFAKAKLIVEAGCVLPKAGTEGVLRENEILFKGLLVGLPIKIEGHFAEIELIAKPSDAQAKIQQLQKEIHIPPYWDDLWHKEIEKPQECQDVHPSFLYCDRRTGEFKRSDWFEGREKIPIQKNFFQESLRVCLINRPLKACTVNVHAHWIQSQEGVDNLSPSIRMAFPHSHMSTYTKEALLKKWPEEGQAIGRSGIYILKSDLKEIAPPSPFCPTYSPAIFNTSENGDNKFYRAKRHWFKPTLWIKWQHQQKRHETLTFTLQHAFQPHYPGEGECKILNFTLQNINPDPGVHVWQSNVFYKEGIKIAYKDGIYQCKITHTSRFEFEEEKWTLEKRFYMPLKDPARCSFFLTDRGYLAAEHAMEWAKSLLAKSARTLEVFFEAPWDILKEMTTDTSVILTDPRLPNGKISGKVVKYALFIKGETGERWGCVTLLCAAGVPLPAKEYEAGQPTYAKEYCRENYQVHDKAIRKTPSGLMYFRYEEKAPPNMDKGPLLRKVELINGPQEQEVEILKQKETNPQQLKKNLSTKTTHLRLHFKDLRTKDKIHHTISVTMASPWSAPCQYLV